MKKLGVFYFSHTKLAIVAKKFLFYHHNDVRSSFGKFNHPFIPTEGTHLDKDQSQVCNNMKEAFKSFSPNELGSTSRIRIIWRMFTMQRNYKYGSFLHLAKSYFIQLNFYAKTHLSWISISHLS